MSAMGSAGASKPKTHEQFYVPRPVETFHQKGERLNVTKRSLSVKRVQLLSNKASAKGDSHIILTLFGLCEGAGLLRTRDDQVIHILLILIHILLILILYQTC